MEHHAVSFVPWAWGINGGSSVLGSILCIVVAMAAGLSAVALVGVAIYIVALAGIALIPTVRTPAAREDAV